MNKELIDLKGAKVLVVDDKPANLGLLFNILSQEGYHVFAAPSGEVALNVIKKVQPQLILLDVMMPGMDGYATCRALKAMPDTGDIPVIFVTAKTEDADIERGFSEGGVDYLCKPIRHFEVCARVRIHLENTLLRSKLRALQQGSAGGENHE